MDELKRLADDVESRVGQMSKGDVAEHPEEKEKEKEARERQRRSPWRRRSRPRWPRWVSW